MTTAKRTDPRKSAPGADRDRGKNPVRRVRIEEVLWDASKAKADVEGTNPNAVVVALLREYLGMDDSETVRDIEKARQEFETRVGQPDPNTTRRTRRKIGSVTATKKGTNVIAGRLSFAVDEDEHGDLIVQTTQFTTERDFEGQHVALLLAYDLREHYAVDALRSSPMEPTDGGSGVVASLRRRGIMTPAETRG